jgi:hypothetical protein
LYIFDTLVTINLIAQCVDMTFGHMIANNEININTVDHDQKFCDDTNIISTNVLTSTQKGYGEKMIEEIVELNNNVIQQKSGFFSQFNSQQQLNLIDNFNNPVSPMIFRPIQLLMQLPIQPVQQNQSLDFTKLTRHFINNFCDEKIAWLDTNFDQTILNRGHMFNQFYHNFQDPLTDILGLARIGDPNPPPGAIITTDAVSLCIALRGELFRDNVVPLLPAYINILISVLAGRQMASRHFNNHCQNEGHNVLLEQFPIMINELTDKLFFNDPANAFTNLSRVHENDMNFLIQEYAPGTNGYNRVVDNIMHSNPVAQLNNANNARLNNYAQNPARNIQRDVFQ